MLAVSGRWAAAIATNHRPTYKAELWRTDTRLIADLRLEAGTVTKDAGAIPRTTATVTVADTSAGTAQLCTPFGSRLRLYRGISYPDNTAPDLPLIADLDIVSSRFNRPDNVLELELADPSALVAGQARLPSGIAAATVVETIQWILSTAFYYGGHTLVDQTTAGMKTIMAPPGYVVDGDPWDALEQLADSIGAECWFTPGRAPVLRPTPTIKVGPGDATLYARDGGTVTLIDSALSRTANVVRVRGAPDDTTGKIIVGTAYDADPASPTYIYGAYGRVVLIEDRPAPFVNQANANTAAKGLLDRAQARIRTVSLECVPNPAIEPGDTVVIRHAGGTLEKHVVTRVDIPLGPADTMRVDTMSTDYTTAGWP